MEIIMILPVSLDEHSYDIVVERGALSRIGELLPLNRKVLVVTDSGVPEQYSNAVLSAALDATLLVLPSGEENKNIQSYTKILDTLLENSFTRTDCVVAVGGGVVGDISGFAAASYMRGIDFYNIPTTLLSQVDSSIGGKTGIDYHGVKNIVGAFHQPKKVVIDSSTLKTLDSRQLHAGLAESIKMSLTSDKELFTLIEASDDLDRDLDEIILRSLKIKKAVVEQDPNEKGLRKVLNFGHTVGHAVESSAKLGTYLHGECVAIGMVYMCSDEVKKRLIPVLEKYCLPTSTDTDSDSLISYILHDKKASGTTVTAVYVETVGSFEFIKLDAEQMKGYLDI